MPGVGPLGASGKQFRVSRCYLWVKGQGAVHRTPLSLTSLPGWTPPPGDTCICVCSPKAHTRPPLLQGPGHYLPLAGSWPLLHSVLSGVPQFSQGEKPMCLGPYGSRELSQCPVLALVRQALIGDPSLLSFNVLIPAFGWESFHKLRFLVPISLCS